MKELIERVDRLIEAGEVAWERRNRSVQVQLWRGDRRHRVRFRRQDGMYVFYAIVVRADFVTRGVKKWNELARRVWRRNAVRQIVSFSFDEQDRLIGVIKQPAETLDDAELRFHIETLARECDRLEYVLTGEDVE